MGEQCSASWWRSDQQSGSLPRRTIHPPGRSRMESRESTDVDEATLVGKALKTIGVLGGMGPQATMEFEAHVHAVSQRLIPQRSNEGYPPMLVWYCRHAPVLRTAIGAPVLPYQPDPRLLEAARVVGTHADFLVLTSNGANRFHQAIEEAAGRPVLSMAELTLAEVQRRNVRALGVLELHERRFYGDLLALRGMGAIYVPQGLQVPLDQGIRSVNEGRVGPEGQAAAHQAVEYLRTQGVDGVILGCTEIPLLLGKEAQAPDLIDPLRLLAEAAVRQAMG
jgi:aspartate racemase